MSRFRRLEVLNAMIESGVIPVFYNADVVVAKKIVNACADGGARFARPRADIGLGPRAAKILALLVHVALSATPCR